MLASGSEQQGAANSSTTANKSEANYNNLPRLYVAGELISSSDPVLVCNNLSDLGKISTMRQGLHQQQPLLSKDQLVPLSADQSHYVTSVLRLTKSSRRTPPMVRLFDASGDEWLAELLLLASDNSRTDGKRRRATASDNSVTAVCRSKLRSEASSTTTTPITCWLCVAPPKKKDRLKWMIEKTTELDCRGYILLDTDYSEGAVVESESYKAAVAPSKTANTVSHGKLQSYAIEAAEQCERLTVPRFVRIKASTDETAASPPTGGILLQDPKSSKSDGAATTKLTDFLRVWSEQTTTNNGVVKLLVCRERSSSLSVWRALQQIYAAAAATATDNYVNDSPTETAGTVVACLIGPEGGWSPREEEKLDELERNHPDAFFNVSLGPTVLRAETAAMTAMAAFTLHHDHYRSKQRQLEQ